MSGYAFHPEAFTDLDQIWEYIAGRNRTKVHSLSSLCFMAAVIRASWLRFSEAARKTPAKQSGGRLSHRCGRTPEDHQLSLGTDARHDR